jgi:ATP-binding cassette, subfamily B, bacterial
MGDTGIFPVFLQQSSIDCGPSALYIVSQYYKFDVDYDTIRSHCQFTNKGVTLKSLMDASAKLGLEPLAITIDLSLLKDIPLPAILFWNRNHYVVLYDIVGNDYYISNPMYGLAHFPEERFKLSACYQQDEVCVLLLNHNSVELSNSI